VLPGREAIVRANECADERGHGHGGADGIHQAKSNGFDEGAGLLDGADGLAVEAPLFAAVLLEFLFGHRGEAISN
jgi:hypothetical protein